MICKHSSVPDTQKGFSLLEVAIILLVLGLLIVPLMQILHIHNIQARRDLDRDKLAAITLAINKYAALNSKLPIPANPTLPFSNTLAGKEANIIYTTGNVCGVPTTISGVKCVPGSRNVSGTANTDPVLIGALPYADLNLTYDQTLDSYGSKFTYAVSRNPATSSSAYSVDYGSINVVDQNYLAAPDVPTKNALFVIFSSGEDKKGAYLANGTQVTCMTGAADSENCNGDSVFKVLTSGTGVLRKTEDGLYLGNNASYYDDIIAYQTDITDDLWRGQAVASKDNVYANPGAKVVIGNSDAVNPQYSLYVANGNDARAYKTLAVDVCDETAKYGGIKGCLKVQDVANDPGNTTNPPVYCIGGYPLNGVTPTASAFRTGMTYSEGSPNCDRNPVVQTTERTVCPNGYKGFTTTGFVCAP